MWHASELTLDDSAERNKDEVKLKFYIKMFSDV